MLNRNNIRLPGLIFFMIVSANTVIAQNSSFEFWPESDIWYTLTPSWRLSAFIPVTKYNETKYRDLNVYLQADYKWGRTKHTIYRRLMNESKALEMKAWMARGGFMEGWSLGENSGSYTEDMLYAELHRRLPLNGGILMSHRIRTDFRWVGTDPKFSYRFRYRVNIEKEYTAGKTSVVPYVNAEVYWDSRYNTFSRFRFIGGTTLAKGSRFAYEGNVTYQYDSHYATPNLYALNLILHIYFETKRAKSS